MDLEGGCFFVTNSECLDFSFLLYSEDTDNTPETITVYTRV